MKRLNKLILAIGLSVAFLMPVSVQAEPVPNSVDVSNHNNIYDYNAIKNSNIQYAYIKATESVTFRDWKLDEHYNNFKQVQIKTGFYHFMSDYASPREQAEHFWDVIKNYNYDLKPCLDIETNSRNLNSYELSNRVLEFCQRFKELSNENCIIYTGAFFGRDNLDDRVKSQYDGWIAHYGVDKPMNNGFNVIGHQFSESYFISGIGRCDVNNFTILVGLGGSGQNNVPIDTSNQITYNYNDCDMIQREKQFVGNRCLELQQLLNKVMNTNISEDSSYGTQTHNLLGQFQQQYFGSADYLAGNQTFAKLKELVESKSVNLTLRDWQQAYNDTYGKHISVDGIWGNESKSAMKNTLVKQGQTNALVGFIQCRVNTTIDNNFGYYTDYAVKQWQSNNGLVSDSKMGYNSFYKMIFG